MVPSLSSWREWAGMAWKEAMRKPFRLPGNLTHADLPVVPVDRIARLPIVSRALENIASWPPSVKEPVAYASPSLRALSRILLTCAKLSAVAFVYALGPAYDWSFHAIFVRLLPPLLGATNSRSLICPTASELFTSRVSL